MFVFGKRCVSTKWMIPSFTAQKIFSIKISLVNMSKRAGHGDILTYTKEILNKNLFSLYSLSSESAPFLVRSTIFIRWRLLKIHLNNSFRFYVKFIARRAKRFKKRANLLPCFDLVFFTTFRRNTAIALLKKKRKSIDKKYELAVFDPSIFVGLKHSIDLISDSI